MSTIYPVIRLLASCTHVGTIQAQSSPNTKKKKIIIFFPHFQTSPGESLLKRLPRTLLFLLHCHNTEHKQLETLCNQIWYALFWCQCFLHPTSLSGQCQFSGSTFRRSRGTSMGVDTRLSATPPSGTAEPGDHQLQAPLPGTSFVDSKAGAVTPDAASPSREALP